MGLRERKPVAGPVPAPPIQLSVSLRLSAWVPPQGLHQYFGRPGVQGYSHFPNIAIPPHMNCCCAASHLQIALPLNSPGLLRLVLSYNGFSDQDAARIIKGLEGNGGWVGGLCVGWEHEYGTTVVWIICTPAQGTMPMDACTSQPHTCRWRSCSH